MSEAEIIYERMFKNRLRDSVFEGRWNAEDRCSVKRKGYKNLKERIEELVSEGKIVTAGYLPSSVRNFHIHYILWRERKNK